MAIKKRSATVVPGASGAAAAVKNPQASKSSFWGELPQHVMSGISRMVPTLIMGGVILAFSQLIAYSWLKIPAEIGIMDALNSGKFSGFDLSLLKFAWLSQSFGGVLFGFAIPMFAAFVANSIGGKLAFPAGFIGGLMSTQPTQLLNFDPSTMQWATSSPVPSTFIGALIISIVAGYLVKWMNQKIQLPDFLLAFKTTFLLPILSAIFVMLAMYYVITPFGGWINGGIRTVLTAAGEKGALMYAMGIAAATAIDLGGPINKAAGFVAFSFTTDHVLPVTESLKKRMAELQSGIQTWCEAHRDELTGNGKVKFANLTTGEVQWRNRPPSVSIRGADNVIELLRRLGLERFIRVKEEINKDAILNEKEAVKNIPGISIKSDIEDFSIIPFEQDVQ